MENKPDKARQKRLKDNYNLTPAEADAIYAFQNNLCAICKKPQRARFGGPDGKSMLTIRLAIDHCHKTGLVRGALCANCNRVFGKLENRGWTVEMLRNLIEYLLNPPAIKALGKSVFGYAGRVGTKKHRLALKRAKKSA